MHAASFFTLLAQVSLIVLAQDFPGDQIAEIPLLSPQTCVALPDLYEASIAELQDGLANVYYSSVDLVKVLIC
jgi:hypothetical protein